MALFHSHTDEYFAYHHRTFIWSYIEIETETHIGALDFTHKVQMSSRSRENMSTKSGLREVHPCIGMVVLI